VTESSTATRGFLAAVAAFLTWGLLPVYLKAVSVIAPLEIMVHRAMWCCVFVMAWLGWQGSLDSVRVALINPTTRWRLALSATLISINWYVYVFAVNSGHVIDTSLGYFINPLLNVLLGVVVLRERLNARQWFAVSCAATGVAYLTWVAGRLPWISLALACSFGLYGLIRKVVNVDAVAGLAGETLMMFPVAAAVLIWLWHHGALGFGHFGISIDALLIGGGILTALPLALFAYGARLIPYSTIGLIQYIAPSLQLALGVWLYHEPFSRGRLLGFSLIWLALIVYAGDSLWRSRQLPGLK
jgi:chloramphenicol-sensitive protein RarD